MPSRNLPVYRPDHDRRLASHRRRHLQMIGGRTALEPLADPRRSDSSNAGGRNFDDLLAILVGGTFRVLPHDSELRKVQLPLLRSLRPWLKANSSRRPKAVLKWLADARQQLESFTVTIPQPPADLRSRRANVKCTCLDCVASSGFSPTRMAARPGSRWPNPAAWHLASNIHTFGCDVDCRTDKSGNPHALVWASKNMASYERKLKQYHEDLKSLAMVQMIGNGV